MQRFTSWARWIAVSVFTLFIIPLAVKFLDHMAEKVGLYERPGETVGAALDFLLGLAEQQWVQVGALILLGLAAGLWLDWFLRKVDGSRATERKVLGAEMAKLGNFLVQVWDPNFKEYTARISSIFTSATKFGIWAPNDHAITVPNKRLITDYLNTIGQMLKDGHFKEAKQYAEKAASSFPKR
jgi:hypothetical protein